MTTPVLSVVLSVFNNRADLPGALKSLQIQTFKDFEVIAINDGSSDGSAEILDSFAREDSRVRVIHQENCGLGYSLERGCREARGEIIVRQDADDISAPYRFERQLRFLESNPDCVLCGCWTWFADVDLKTIFASEVPNNSKQLIGFLEAGINPFVHGSVMLRTKAYYKLNQGYRFTNPIEDFDLWLRLSEQGTLGMLESVSYYYRMHLKSISAATYSLRPHLVRQALVLHDERKKLGTEQASSLGKLSDAIELARNSNRAPEEFARYSAAIEHLRAGDLRSYRELMQAASLGSGKLANKARWHLALSRVPGLLATWYRWRLRNAPGKYFRKIAPNELMPEEIKALWHSHESK